MSKDALGTFARAALLIVAVGRSARAAPDVDLVSAQVTASSMLRDDDGPHSAWFALDGESDTSWCEGAHGNGTGESLTIELTPAVPLTRLDFRFEFNATGSKTPDLDTVPDELVVATDNAQRVVVTPNARGEASAELRGGAVGKLTLTFSKGARHGDRACITDVALFAHERVGVVVGVNADAMNALPAAIDHARQVLADCKGKELVASSMLPLVSDLTRVGHPTKTRRLASAAELATACTNHELPDLDANAIHTVGSSTPTEATLRTDEVSHTEARHNAVTLRLGSDGWRISSVAVETRPIHPALRK